MYRYVWVYIDIYSIYMYIQYRYACMYANTLLYISLHIKRDGEHRDCNKRCSTSNAMSGPMIFSSSLGCGFSIQMTMQQRDSYRKPGFRLPKITTESIHDKKRLERTASSDIFRVPCQIMTILNENNLQSFFWYFHAFQSSDGKSHHDSTSQHLERNRS